MSASFMVASIYMVGWLRGRRDRLHRLGILIPFTVAAIATPLQFVVGDAIARWVYQEQPAKFAAMEVVTQSGPDQPEYLFGRYDPVTNTVSGGLKIPGMDSYLAGGSRSTSVAGLAAVAPQDRASNVTLVHWAFDIMVLIATLLLALVAWYAVAYWKRRDVPHLKLFQWITAAAGVLAYVALEAGWITTEVGRQPWVVYNIARTSDAVTTSSGIPVSLTVVIVVYTLLGAATITVLRVMSRRWREAQVEEDSAVPYGPRTPSDAVRP
jgi:cytochrome d ubiquinol oxidase subunit I